MNPPPFLIAFSTEAQFLKALPEATRLLYEQDFHQLVSEKLPPIVSLRFLATLFGFSPQFIGAIYIHPERYYRSFTIRRGKKNRVIHAPKVALKVIQKWFGYYLAETLKFPDCVFGFIKGRSAIEAAAVHCGAKWVYSIDIENFFPSTPQQKVLRALVGLGYPEHGAELAAKLCCFNGALAQGSPASPVLSNLVFWNTDKKLQDLANGFGLRYTRYADDITLSGQEEIPLKLKPKVREIISSGEWKIAEKKENLARQPSRLKVHGLLVHGEIPRLTKGYRNKIRAFKHLLEVGGVKPGDISRLRGHLSFANSVKKP